MRTTPDAVEAALTRLREHKSQATLAGMERYAIPSENALGVTVKDIRALGKQLGRNQDLASALWDTGVYEARMLASFVGDPERITAAEMERWAVEFDSWAVCDSVCFHLFDRTPHAWKKVERWSNRKEEFVRRAAFATLWGLSVHDRAAKDEPFLKSLALIEKAASDDRNFVKKAVNMALRAVGKRNTALREAELATGRKLAQSEDATARWVGRDAVRELSGRAAGAVMRK